MRIALFAALAVSALLMVYLHQRARSEVAVLRRVLEEAHVRHSKLTSELKGKPFYVSLQGRSTRYKAPDRPCRILPAPQGCPTVDGRGYKHPASTRLHVVLR